MIEQLNKKIKQIEKEKDSKIEEVSEIFINFNIVKSTPE